jgi:hypothetical protein
MYPQMLVLNWLNALVVRRLTKINTPRLYEEGLHRFVCILLLDMFFFLYVLCWLGMNTRDEWYYLLKLIIMSFLNLYDWILSLNSNHYKLHTLKFNLIRLLTIYILTLNIPANSIEQNLLSPCISYIYFQSDLSSSNLIKPQMNETGQSFGSNPASLKGKLQTLEVR